MRYAEISFGLHEYNQLLERLATINPMQSAITKIKKKIQP